MASAPAAGRAPMTMGLPTAREKPAYVRGLFARIAGRYDLLNRVMTAGQDRRWRRRAIDWAAPPPGGRLLDLGAGTGDLALTASARVPGLRVVAADFTPEMLAAGRAKPRGAAITWTVADALRLPFADAQFDAVTSAFLLRNVADLPAALAEQRRVLRPGGRVVCLDTTRPPRGLRRPLVAFHLHTVIPALGRLLGGDREAYTYLPESTERFLSAEELAAQLAVAGFGAVRFRRLMWGTIALHAGVR